MSRRTKRRIGLFLSLVGLQLALLFSALSAAAVRQTGLAFTSTTATLWTAPAGIGYINVCGYGGGGGGGGGGRGRSIGRRNECGGWRGRGRFAGCLRSALRDSWNHLRI